MAQGDLYSMPQFSNSGLGRMGNRALARSPMGMANRFSRAAQRAQKMAMAEAFDAIGKAHGEELAGTPGFLAAKSMGPGGLARLRGKNLRSGVSRLASANYGIAADTAKSVRDFVGQSELAKQQAQLQKEANSGGGFLGDIGGRLVGAGVGFLTGGPAGAVAGGLAGSGAAGGGPSNAAYTPMPDTAEDLFRTGRTNNYYGYRQDPYRR